MEEPASKPLDAALKHSPEGQWTSRSEKKKQKIIQWDEVAIAEHDKERGSRQKIDEAPTPFRYGSESSDQSEAESGSSDGEPLTRRRRRKHKKHGVSPDGSGDQSSDSSFYSGNEDNNSKSRATNSVFDSWETIHAKLQYEKHLQEQQKLAPPDPDSMDIDTITEHESHWHPESDPHQTEFGEIPTHLQPTEHINTKQQQPSRPAIRLGSPTKRDRKIHETALNTYQNKKLPATKSVLIRNNPSSTFSTMNDDIGDEADDEEGEEEERAKFRSKRAGHYNEFKILQALRNTLRSEDEEDDDKMDEEDEKD